MKKTKYHNIEINNNISYLIGLFQTDGSISLSQRNRGKASIELDINDSNIIYEISDLIPYNYTIFNRKRNIKLKNKVYESETIGIRCTEIGFRNFLINSGVPSGKKSDIIEPPLHLENLSITDYVRGLYDGDGSLGFIKTGQPYVSFTTASDKCVNFLNSFLSELTNKPLKIISRNKRDDIYNIVIKNEEAQLFCKEIYYDNCLSINRKYKKSLEIQKWIRPDNIKKKLPQKFWKPFEDDYIQNHTMDESINYLNRSKKSIQIRLIRLKNNFKY